MSDVDLRTLSLCDETLAAIDAEMARYPAARGALLFALHHIQDELGCISTQTARAVAGHFGIRPIEVMEVVSFYTMFHDRPQGRHQVDVCTNLPCSLRGARGLLARLEEYLDVRAGETSEDGRITLGHEECLGACAYAPMMRVDGTYHEDLDFEKARRLLDGLE